MNAAFFLNKYTSVYLYFHVVRFTWAIRRITFASIIAVTIPSSASLPDCQVRVVGNLEPNLSRKNMFEKSEFLTNIRY